MILELFKYKSYLDGNIIVINADCLDVMKEIQANSIDLLLTDCPYKIIAGGVRIIENKDEPSGIFSKRDYNKTDPQGILSRRGIVVDNNKIGNKWLKKDTSQIPCAVKNGKMFDYNDIISKEWLKPTFDCLKKQSHAYIMINGRNLKDLQQESENAGFEYQNLLVWNKNNATPNKYYMQQLEFILMLSKRPARNINNMGTKNLFNIPNIIGNKAHPCEKPVSLMQILIENSTNENDIVFDPFCGSGATAIASIKSKRKCIAVEIDTVFFDITCNRIESELKQTILI